MIMANEVLLSSIPLEVLLDKLAERLLKNEGAKATLVVDKKEKVEYLTRREVTEYLGISLPTLNEWTKSGKLIGYRIGTRVRYKRNEVDNSLKQMRVK